MKPEIGVEYNIQSTAGSARGHQNPIFRGRVTQIRHNEYLVDIAVTEYNITSRYKPGKHIPGIHMNRLISIVERPNRQSKNVLTKFEEESWHA